MPQKGATTLFRRRSRIPVRVRWRARRQRITFRLHVLLDLFDCAIELLVFAVKFLRRIVIDHDIGIDAVTFDDPFLAVLRKGRELRPKQLAAIRKRKRITDSNHAAPGPFSDQLAKTEGLES